ncbi:hypothetical protein JHK87_043470 [Glycine soja]|nr:hypothetical protein JHK87_043470 [Glycine soja]
MVHAPDKIKLIDGSRETLKLAVRITDLWFFGIPNKSEQAEMVIVDSDGDEIHVICKQDQLKSWKADLKENSTYVLHNFKVLNNDGQFRVYDHQYKLAFTGVIVIRQSNLDSLPFRKFKFDDFYNVIAGDFQTGLLVGIEVKSVLTPLGQSSSQLSGSTQLSSMNAFLSKAEAKSISQINAISKGGDVDLNASPQALDRLLGCVLAFKVKVQSKFNNVVVLKYSNELDLINVVQDMLLDTEQFVSVIADHDPLLRVPLTPTKHLSADELDDEPRSSEISPAQLSSNKLSRPSPTK